MALSNIWREPRREITESVVGLAALIPAALFDNWFAAWFIRNVDDRCPPPIAYFLGILSLGLGCFFLVAFAIFSHYVGEEVCDRLAKRGLELRPKVRR